MSAGWWVVLGLVAYLTVGAVTATAIARRTTYFTTRAYGVVDVDGAAVACVLFAWPIAVPYAVVYLTTHGTVRRLARVEKELADAEREVERLLTGRRSA